MLKNIQHNRMYLVNFSILHKIFIFFMFLIIVCFIYVATNNLYLVCLRVLPLIIITSYILFVFKYSIYIDHERRSLCKSIQFFKHNIQCWPLIDIDEFVSRYSPLSDASPRNRLSRHNIYFISRGNRIYVRSVLKHSLDVQLKILNNILLDARGN
jgi:hypothetical protein